MNNFLQIGTKVLLRQVRTVLEDETIYAFKSPLEAIILEVDKNDIDRPYVVLCNNGRDFWVGEQDFTVIEDQTQTHK